MLNILNLKHFSLYLRLALVVAVIAIAPAAQADVHVNGYYRKDGTYVQPHYRSDPDGNPYNNYSTRGNTNPYTGREGTVDPDSRSGGYSNPYASQYQNPYAQHNNGWGQ